MDILKSFLLSVAAGAVVAVISKIEIEGNITDHQSEELMQQKIYTSNHLIDENEDVEHLYI